LFSNKRVKTPKDENPTKTPTTGRGARKKKATCSFGGGGGKIPWGGACLGEWEGTRRGRG